MVPEGGRVLIGVSGGADSVCLCLILYELSTKMNFSLEVIHVEHGIRGEESKNDAVFVEQLCKQRGIVCHIRNVDVPRYAKIHHLGEEEAARILRYQVFADAAGLRTGQELFLPFTISAFT
jgi:tRNA(Ile)-lysidine synthase